jgi:hypothetical protein
MSQPKAQGLLHIECEFNHTPYKTRLDNYSGYEHLIVLTQPRKYSEDTIKTSSRELKDAFRSTQMPAVLSYEELGGVGPGHTGLSTWCSSPRIRNGTWPTPYICCNYSYAVGLLIQ